MSLYHKIQTVYHRDPATSHKTLLDGEWSKPEFAYLRGLDWEITEKIDGTNIRVMWDGDTCIFGGRTDRAQIPSPLVNWLNNQFLTTTGRRVLKAVLGEEGKVVLYGEGYGAGIQKGGGNYRPSPEFILFDVAFDNLWLSRENVDDIAQKLGIESVPILANGTLDFAINLVRGGICSTTAQADLTVAEGVVCRPAVELLSRRGERVITKIKHKDFES
jgi:hypothetical protein